MAKSRCRNLVLAVGVPLSWFGCFARWWTSMSCWLLAQLDCFSNTCVGLYCQASESVSPWRVWNSLKITWLTRRRTTEEYSTPEARTHLVWISAQVSFLHKVLPRTSLLFMLSLYKMYHIDLFASRIIQFAAARPMWKKIPHYTTDLAHISAVDSRHSCSKVSPLQVSSTMGPKMNKDELNWIDE